METGHIHWQVYEYVYRHKSADWYWALGIVAIALAFVAFMLDNALFAVTIVVGAAALALVTRQKPDMLTCELDEQGVTVNDKFYPYSRFKVFGIDDETHPNKLILRQKGLSPEVILPLNHNPRQIREHLEKFIEEDEIQEPLSHKIMEYLGF